MTTTKGFITGAATSALDTRKADAALLVSNAAGTPRVGVFGEVAGATAGIVTADASTAPMRVAVAKADFATQRSAADGVAIWTNDGSIFVTVTKPISNSHYVVVYAKHNDTVAGDANNLSVIDVVTGAAAASPSVPAVPSGALELARVLIPSTATATTSGGVVITNVYPLTVCKGGVIPFRDATERDAYVASDGQLGRIAGSPHLYERWSAGWRYAGGVKPICRASKTGAQATSASAGTYAAIAFDAETLDAFGMHDPVTNNTRVTVPAGFTGTFRAIGHTGGPSTSAGMGLAFAVNGVIVASTLVKATGTAATTVNVLTSDLLSLTAGDYVELWVNSNLSSVTIDPANSSLSLEFVSA